MQRLVQIATILFLVTSASMLAIGYDPSGPVLFVLEGTFSQETVYTYTVTATPESVPADLSVAVHVPTSRSWQLRTQEISDLTQSWNPNADVVLRETDRSENVWSTATWLAAQGPVECVTHVRCVEEAQLLPMVTWWSDNYPLDWRGFPEDVVRWLEPDPLWIQSKAPEIQQLADQLSAGAVLQIEVVGRVLAWLHENVRMAQCDEDIPQVDALWTLQNRMGACVNFSNLALALLRAAGIPSAPVTGLVAVSEDPGVLHAWISVFFPDLGWTEFESSSWMPGPLEGALPSTILTPQHITLHSGDSRGVSSAPFLERNECSIDISQTPRELQFVNCEIEAGDAVTWVVTLRSPSYYEVYEWEYGYRDLPVSVSLDGVPPGWHVSVSADQFLLRKQDVGASPSRSFLLTVKPPDDAEAGTQGLITLTARDTGKAGHPVVGVLTAAVAISAPQ